MLNKVEFSDLYKFQTSVGLILIAASIILPWLLLKDAQGIEISVEDYEGLHLSSKELVDKRIELNMLVVRSIPYITILTLLSGLIVTFFGYKKWKLRQGKVDQTEDLRLEELRKQVGIELNPSEIQLKAIQEVKEIEGDVSTENKSKSLTENNLNLQESRDPVPDLVEGLISMEKKFLSKIEKFNSFNYTVKSNVKLVKDFNIDIFLHAFNNKNHKDLLIDIRFLQKSLNMTSIRDAVITLRRAHSQYTHTVKRNTQAYLFVVYNDNIALPDEIKRFRSAIDSLILEIGTLPIQIILLSESNVNDYDISKIVA